MSLENELHRLAKQFIDSEKAKSLEEAMETLQQLRLVFSISEPERVENQIALLTGVTLARRVFLGGVFVNGNLDTKLNIKIPVGENLGEAVKNLGGKIESLPNSELPMVSISSQPETQKQDFHIRTLYSGWRGGIIPAQYDLEFEEQDTMPLAPMLSSAMAVNEAFLHMNGNYAESGSRCAGISLWQPSADVDWRKKDSSEMSLERLPNKLWIIGLGHLGQAYLWALGLLPYPNHSDVELVLQDTDVITKSTISTSILTEESMVGRKKTREVIKWVESVGFKARIFERNFDKNISRQDNEPRIALCGIDNAIGRQALDQVGFDLIFEAGLGGNYQNFQEISVHTLPASRTAAQIWKVQHSSEIAGNQSAYQSLLKKGELDQCGITTLAGKAVGAPFVGAVAASIVLSECLRFLHNGNINEFIDIDLACVDYRKVFPNTRVPKNNPGFVQIPKS